MNNVSRQITTDIEEQVLYTIFCRIKSEIGYKARGMFYTQAAYLIWDELEKDIENDWFKWSSQQCN